MVSGAEGKFPRRLFLWRGRSIMCDVLERDF